MSTQHSITFFHSPHTRASSTLILLEELGVPYELRVLNMKAGEQRQPTYLAVNPLGKVPAIVDGATIVTEQVAIFIHLADRFPEAGLAPSLDDPRRGAYLRWLVYYAACFEPALVDRSLGRDPGPAMSSPYGDFDAMIGVIDAQLQRSPYLLGDTMSAADVLWGSALVWGMAFAGVPRLPALVEYAGRMAARPASKRVAERDNAWIAEHEAALAVA
ncbi:glutathione S-transferase family protein [Massilia oculi]|uniref:Glutathione S-transferase family protein n=1 Tax=Massilia hydrophila TaxID=3044279 RepID=A0ABS7Y8I9_9BURK|nr:glutathione S-transferase family protein [Massilia oculi]MCA1856005.1 glutathione S-transferase family protein [Massilia oculi]